MAQQLRLFMTAGELKATQFPYVGDYGRSGAKDYDEFWGMKEKEADKSGLTESIKESGVKKPVSLSFPSKTPNGPYTGMVIDGHHRIAATHKLNPEQFVPVVYGDLSNPNLFQR